MKVKAKWKYFEGKKLELKEASTTWCCDEAEDSSAITFGEFDTCLNQNKDVNISSCMPFPEGAVWEEEAINFCPFCGENIEVEIEE